MRGGGGGVEREKRWAKGEQREEEDGGVKGKVEGGRVEGGGRGVCVQYVPVFLHCNVM